MFPNLVAPTGGILSLPRRSPLGHADPDRIPRVYAHAMKRDEPDLSFVEFGVAKPRHPSLAFPPENDESSNPLKSLVGRGGLEPPTLGLKVRCSPN